MTAPAAVARCPGCGTDLTPDMASAEAGLCRFCSHKRRAGLTGFGPFEPSQLPAEQDWQRRRSLAAEITGLREEFERATGQLAQALTEAATRLAAAKDRAARIGAATQVRDGRHMESARDELLAPVRQSVLEGLRAIERLV
jgi:multidrug resistance efflux pump